MNKLFTGFVTMALGLAMSVSVYGVEHHWGFEVVDFKFSMTKKITRAKAMFMLQAMLDDSKVPGTTGLYDLEIDNDTLKMKFKVYRGEGIDADETMMNLAHWGVDARLDDQEGEKETSRWIVLSNVKSIELFKGTVFVRRQGGRTSISQVGRWEYFCRLVTGGGKDFVIRTHGAKEALRLAAAFSALTDLEVSHNKHLHPVGLNLDDEFRVIETNALGKVTGLPLFAIIKGINGGKVVVGDDVVSLLGEMETGINRVLVQRPDSSKTKELDVKVK